MESVLRGLVASTDHPDQLKNQFLDRVLSGLKRGEQSRDEATALFRVFLEWILVNSEKPELNLVRRGHEQFVLLANANPDVFRDYVSANLVIDIFNNNQFSNKAEIAPLIGEILSCLEQENDDSHTVRSITNVAKTSLAHLLRDQGVHLDVASSIGLVYTANPALLPSPNDWMKTTSKVVNLLSTYRCANPNPETGVVSPEFVERVDNVSQILQLIWGQSTEHQNILACLREFYCLISTSRDEHEKPSCALMSFVDKLPSAMMEKAMAVLIEDNYAVAHEEGKTVIGLQTMIIWLTQRPSALLTNWINHVLKGLQKSNRISVLIEITHGTLEKLLWSLPVPELQDSVEDLFFYLLLGFQHSETAFHRTLTKLPRVIEKLAANIKSPGFGDRSGSILSRLAEAVLFFVKKFPNTPSLYQDAVTSLEAQNLSNPSPNETRFDELESLAWLNSADYGLQQDQVIKSSTGENDNQPNKNKIGPRSLTLQRSPTGMVGLVNLGNTCYMNSVLQALYITNKFCDMVLSSTTSGGQQPVLSKLQQTFAFLKHTMRAIYSPSDFLKAARPPWFEAGRQQDCSEFIKYLLDTLQEQEKCGRKGATTYREHCVIEPPKITTTEATVNSSNEEQPMEVKNSFSTNALDSISEAPETSGNADVDMLSQGSGAEEDFMFGSRGSLSTHHKNNNADSEEESDIGGSRNSLSGLKRWTTEENLVFNGEQTRTSETMDGPLHDSHSNSTDSGIQSVGDSIRGSSDSMTPDGQNGGVGGVGAGSGQHLSTSSAKQKQNSDCVMRTASDERPELDDDEGVDKSFVSLVQKVFGGKLQTTYECSNCNHISLHKEHFTDIHLALPNRKGSSVDETKLTMQDLLATYLTPETLKDDNQYHCDHCGNLQDALKTMKVLEGPEYLITTLMRFHYDRAQNRKSKVFTDINYELDLRLPVHNPKDNTDREEKYSLYAVVVHSGYSSDGGHYYTYAREPDRPDQWYIFNDSRVSLTNFQNFKNVSKTFPRDTAYLLFYHREPDQSDQETGDAAEGVEANVIENSSSGRHHGLARSDLKMIVEADNVKFMREKERSASSSSSSTTTMSTNFNHRRGGGSGGSSGGCGGGGFNTPGRFIC